MKREILEKLVEDQPLSAEEIVFISRNLGDSNVETIPFDHDNKNPMKACGFDEADVNMVNDKFSVLMKGKDQKVSIIVETVEKMMAADQKLFRMVVMQAIKHAQMEATRQTLSGDSFIEMLMKRMLPPDNNDPNKNKD